MEILVLALFCIFLILCIVLDLSVLYALLAGLVLFSLYALLRGCRLRQLGKMLLSGILTAKSILIMLALIGLLTALWRDCGTIPVMICYAARLIRPRTVVLMTFLLCCAVSMLMGTAFGTAATMGAICMTMGVSMGASPVLLGGAILSGVFFGDRCSPVSTSALLVSELTQTDIFGNIRAMLRTALVPFLVSCAVFGLAGLTVSPAAAVSSLTDVFGRALRLHPAALLPAAVILVMALLRVNVRLTLLGSVVCAAAVSLLLQKTPLTELPRILLSGYTAPDAEAARLLNGGGLTSMLKVMAIICISSSYAGVFRETGLLDALKRGLAALSRKISPFGSILLASAATSMVSCNQTLAIMLTHQLCGGISPDADTPAVVLEDSVVVLAPLVPWSIAGAVPLTSVGAPTKSLFAAFFLYLLPLWTLLRHLHARGKAKPPAQAA